MAGYLEPMSTKEPVTPPATQDAQSSPMGAWVLVARKLHDCHLHRIGDRILLRPPALHHAGQSCCLIPFLRLRNGLRSGLQGDIRCNWIGCKGTWSPGRDESAQDEDAWDPGQLEADLDSRPFLLQLPQAVALALINSGSRIDHPAGAIVLRNGQSNQELYLVVKGALEVVEGEMRVALIPRGDCFGELSILTHQTVSNTVRAAEDCTLVAVPRDRFYELLSRYGSLGTLMNRLLAKRLRASNQQLEQILRPGIWGNLEIFPFLSVVQSIQASAMSGVLTITQARSRASFGFDTGRLRYAQMGAISGEDALLEIFRWTSGVFRFQNEELRLTPNIHGETMSVLLDALRRFDEQQLADSTPGANVSSSSTGLTDTQTWIVQAPEESDSTDGDTLVQDDITGEFEVIIPKDPDEA